MIPEEAPSLLGSERKQVDESGGGQNEVKSDKHGGERTGGGTKS